MHDDIVINIDDLERSYNFSNKLFSKKKDNILVLKKITFNVKKGETIGVLGPNGSGKTTLFKILSTLLLPDKGKVTILGFDVEKEMDKIRSKISFSFGGERGLYLRLTGEENLIYYGQLYNMKLEEIKERINYWLNKVGLLEWKNKRVETYSRGMRQRLHLARCFLTNPEIIILDEPTTGLDPIGIKDIIQLIQDLKKENKVFLIATHNMKEAEKLCDRVILLDKGNILNIGNIDSLRKNVFDRIIYDIEFYHRDHEKIISELKTIEDSEIIIQNINNNEVHLHIYTLELDNIQKKIFDILKTVNLLKEYSKKIPSLEEVYLHQIGR